MLASEDGRLESSLVSREELLGSLLASEDGLLESSLASGDGFLSSGLASRDGLLDSLLDSEEDIILVFGVSGFGCCVCKKYLTT